METIRVAVKDSSVLIDLANAGLIGHWFKLGIETFVTDSVLVEVQTGPQSSVIQPFVDAELIKVHSIPDKDAALWLNHIRETMDGMGISFADAASYLCAQQLDAVLLTGDRVLRRAAERRGVHVCGILWILDLLLWEGVIDCEEALASLKTIRSERARLPATECKLRITNWGKGNVTRPWGPSRTE